MGETLVETSSSAKTQQAKVSLLKKAHFLTLDVFLLLPDHMHCLL